MDARIPYSLGSVLLLLGAFALGWVIHQVVVRGAMGPLSPPAVLGAVLGVAAIAAGRRLERQFDPSAYVPDDPEEDEDGTDFDEERSPVPAERLEGLDRDEPEE